MYPGTEQTPVARMDVPSEGGCCCAGVVLAFVGVFVALAVDNLAHGSTPVLGIVASVLWLALVAFVLVIGVWGEGGVRASAVTVLGTYSRRHFVEVARAGDRTVIGFGYELFGRRFYYLRVASESVLSVNMSTGQATALAGRDMNDWHVALWYRDPARPARTPPVRFRDDELILVGLPRAKETTAEFFRAFVAFLRAAGVELHPTEKETEFRTGLADPPEAPA